MEKEAMEHFKDIGTVVYLELPPELLEERLGSLKERGLCLMERQLWKRYMLTGPHFIRNMQTLRLMSRESR